MVGLRPPPMTLAVWLLSLALRFPHATPQASPRPARWRRAISRRGRGPTALRSSLMRRVVGRGVLARSAAEGGGFEDAPSPSPEGLIPGSTPADALIPGYTRVFGKSVKKDSAKLTELWSTYGITPRYEEAKIEVGVSEDRGRGIEVKAGKTLEAGEVMLAIPFEHAITVPLDPEDPEDNSDYQLALSLLHAIQSARQGEADDATVEGRRAKNWLWYAQQILPAMEELPLGAYWTDEELEEMQHEPSIALAQQFASRFRLFAELSGRRDTALSVLGRRELTACRTWRRRRRRRSCSGALGIVNSRSFAATIRPEFVSSPSFLNLSSRWDESDGEAAAFEGGELVRILCPVTDLFNHEAESPQSAFSSGGHNYWRVGRSQGDGSEQQQQQQQQQFVILAPKSYGPNEEILLPYGAETNLELLMAYGFLPDSLEPGEPASNPADYVPIFGDLAHLVTSVAPLKDFSDEQIDERLDMLFSLSSCEAPLAARPGPREASDHLLGCLEVALAEDEQLSWMYHYHSRAAGHEVVTMMPPQDSEDRVRDDALDLRANALRVAMEAVDQMIVAMPSSMKEDESLLAEIQRADKRENDRLEAAVRYRMGVKKILLDFYTLAALEWENLGGQLDAPPKFLVRATGGGGGFDNGLKMPSWDVETTVNGEEKGEEEEGDETAERAEGGAAAGESHRSIVLTSRMACKKCKIST
eukprot:jgi/Bigna1/84591/fgenesh1_pg.167_\